MYQLILRSFNNKKDCPTKTRYLHVILTFSLAGLRNVSSIFPVKNFVADNSFLILNVTRKGYETITNTI